MRDQLKRLSQETLTYGASAVFRRFLNFLLVPFYVNVLHSTAEYGIVASLYAYLGFLNVIYPLGLEGAYFRYAARGEKVAFSREREAPLFGAPFLVVFIVSTLLSLAIYFGAAKLVWPIFHDPHVDITPLAPNLIRILRFGAGILFFDGLCIIPFAALRLEHEAKRYAIFQTAGSILTVLLNVYLIVVRGWGVPGVFAANFAGSAFVFILLLPTILARLTWRMDREVLAKMLPFGLTNVPAYLGSMMVQVIDRPIVQAYLGLGILGVYQANYRMGFVMMIFVSLFDTAWRPFFMRQTMTDDVQARRIFARVFTYFMLLSMLAFLGLSWMLPILLTTPIHGVRLLRPDYFGGLSIIPVVLFAYVFQGMYTNFIAGIYIKEHNKVLPFITGLGAAVNILANIILIPRLGIMGAAWATLFAYMAMAASIYWQAQRVYPIPYDWPRVGKLLAIAGFFYAIERLISSFRPPSLGFAFTLRAVLFAGALGTLFLAGFFSAGEKKFLREILR